MLARWERLPLSEPVPLPPRPPQRAGADATGGRAHCTPSRRSPGSSASARQPSSMERLHHSLSSAFSTPPTQYPLSANSIRQMEIVEFCYCNMLHYSACFRWCHWLPLYRSASSYCLFVMNLGQSNSVHQLTVVSSWIVLVEKKRKT